MKKILVSLLLSFVSFSALAAGDVQKECVLRASWFADIAGLYNNPVRQCTKEQVKLFIHEAANGGTKTMNNCIQQNGYKIPAGVDSKRFERWGKSVTENIWSNSLRDPNVNDIAMTNSFAEACMNNPDKFIGDQWFYK